MNNNDIIIGLADVSLFLANIGKKEYSKTVEEACCRLRNQDWIPVCKRKPQEAGSYIVFVKEDYQEGTGTYVTIRDWIAFYEMFNCGAFETVTHWMPLPKPPKEGDHDA